MMSSRQIPHCLAGRKLAADVLMPDVNVLVYAHRGDDPAHEAYRDWMEKLVNDRQPFALSAMVAVGFVRVVTNRRIFATPTPLSAALSVIDEVANSPQCRWMFPRESHWGEVSRLCRATQATGKLVADAQHAALAIAEGCTFVTRDEDFAQFATHGLRWQHLELR